MVLPDDIHEALVTCRGGLEEVVAGELRALNLEVAEVNRRAVRFKTDLGGIYRANMALRCGLNVLVPLRTFNARNYDMLYYQSRKTNWHKWFGPERTLRIDLSGGSHVLTHTAYVVHRVKDGMVDTFRKLCGGVRPSIDKRDPDLHVVAHLEGTKVTLCMDSSGLPLFKRGYRVEHGEAPLKEDLAAGLLLLSGYEGRGTFVDPMCGAGTLLFEAWMIAARKAPCLDRRFAFQSWFGYNPSLHAEERKRLAALEVDPGVTLVGMEKDPATFAVLKKIAHRHFSQASVDLRAGDFFESQDLFPGALVLCNPPYGRRLESDSGVDQLYARLAGWLKEKIPGGRSLVFTANREAAQAAGLAGREVARLRNGALECVLFEIAEGDPDR